MGFEAQKTGRIRGTAFTGTYFSGRVLDIGCGPDLVVPSAQPFDIEHGDANRILDHLSPESFDCVHSSHCLEHMRDVPDALAQWWALVKPGGYMVIVVPHEDLYEQGYWPSIFNADHKATFRLDKPTSWSPVSYDLRQLVTSLRDCELVDIQIQDNGYDYSLLRIVPGKFGQMQRLLGRSLLWLQWRRKGMLHRLHMVAPRLDHLLDRVERQLGKPVPQTDGEALAQIQAVLRKR